MEFIVTLRGSKKNPSILSHDHCLFSQLDCTCMPYSEHFYWLVWNRVVLRTTTIYITLCSYSTCVDMILQLVSIEVDRGWRSYFSEAVAVFECEWQLFFITITRQYLGETQHHLVSLLIVHKLANTDDALCFSRDSNTLRRGHQYLSWPFV